MVLFDNSLKELINKNLIEGKEAHARASNPKEFEEYLK
jgi:hypothetical protein